MIKQSFAPVTYKASVRMILSASNKPALSQNNDFSDSCFLPRSLGRCCLVNPAAQDIVKEMFSSEGHQLCPQANSPPTTRWLPTVPGSPTCEKCLRERTREGSLFLGILFFRSLKTFSRSSGRLSIRSHWPVVGHVLLPRPIASGSEAAVTGGLELTGRWSSSSPGHHADSVLLCLTSLALAIPPVGTPVPFLSVILANHLYTNHLYVRNPLSCK